MPTGNSCGPVLEPSQGVVTEWETAHQSFNIPQSIRGFRRLTVRHATAASIPPRTTADGSGTAENDSTPVASSNQTVWPFEAVPAKRPRPSLVTEMLS